MYRETGKQSVDPIIDRQAQQVLHKFHNGYDLSGICTITDLAPSQIFRLLQMLIAPPSSRRPGNMEVPIEGQICVPKLFDVVRDAGSLFCTALLKGFRSCPTILEAVELSTRASHEFSQREHRNPHPMALFVMQMVGERSICLRIPLRRIKSDTELENQIWTLRSVRGQLLRRCRTVKEQHTEYVSALRVRLSKPHFSEPKPEEFFMKVFDLETIVSSESPVRANVFREMVELARHGGKPRYSDNLYHMAVVLMFRSHSSDEFLRQFLPLPAPSSICHHFRNA
jgi:hypothetical protein